MEKIRQYFEVQTKIDDKEWNVFASRLTKRVFLKKQILLQEGEIENYLSFIESGIVRLYVPKEENDLTFAFAFDDTFVSGYESFLTRKPSRYNIECITKTTLWRLSYNDLQEIYHRTTVGNMLGRLAGEDLFLRKSAREFALMNDSAEQRYQDLFTHQPHLLQHIKLKHIASYIGITPQALSRIRRQI